ncbi:MAG: hypothetical protein ACRDG3_07205 [Tepidiformaceae bacterium]
MKTTLTRLLGLSAGLAALALSVAACGGGGHGNLILDPPLGTATANLSGIPLVNALANGGFPGVHLSVPHSAGSTSALNGPELSDQKLNAGVLSEVNVDLGGTDSKNSGALRRLFERQPGDRLVRHF